MVKVSKPHWIRERKQRDISEAIQIGKPIFFCGIGPSTCRNTQDYTIINEELFFPGSKYFYTGSEAFRTYKRPNPRNLHLRNEVKNDIMDLHLLVECGLLRGLLIGDVIAPYSGNNPDIQFKRESFFIEKAKKMLSHSEAYIPLIVIGDRDSNYNAMNFLSVGADCYYTCRFPYHHFSEPSEDEEFLVAVANKQLPGDLSRLTVSNTFWRNMGGDQRSYHPLKDIARTIEVFL